MKYGRHENPLFRVPCTTCGAAIDQPCKRIAGHPRDHDHRAHKSRVWLYCKQNIRRSREWNSALCLTSNIQRKCFPPDHWIDAERQSSVRRKAVLTA
jgi:hypothetical protein